MSVDELEIYDTLEAAKLVLSRLGVHTDQTRQEQALIPKNKKLTDAITHIESIEQTWEAQQSDDNHTYGRKVTGEEIKLWSVPKRSAEFLQDLVILTGATNIIEIGTSAGYAALHLAHAASLTNGKVYTIELMPEKIELAKNNFSESGINNITLVEGEASHVLETWNYGPIDFVFLDADKENYGNYLDQLLPLMTVGGLIIADNINDYGHMMEDYLQRVTGTHLPESRCDRRVRSYYLAALDNGLMITKKISDS